MDGLTGTLPEWYGVMQAAKYLGVAPWELVERSIYWKDKALIAMSAEHWAADFKRQHR